MLPPCMCPPMRMPILPANALGRHSCSCVFVAHADACCPMSRIVHPRMRTGSSLAHASLSPCVYPPMRQCICLLPVTNDAPMRTLPFHAHAPCPCMTHDPHVPLMHPCRSMLSNHPAQDVCLQACAHSVQPSGVQSRLHSACHMGHSSFAKDLRTTRRDALDLGIRAACRKH